MIRQNEYIKPRNNRQKPTKYLSNKDEVVEERQSKKHEELSTKKQRKPNTEKNAN